MERAVDKRSFRVGMTSSLMMHTIGGLIATFVLVYEPPPIDLSQVKPLMAVPVMLEQPKPKPPEPEIKPKPKPEPKPSLKKVEEPPPPEPVEEPPPPQQVDTSVSPSYLALVRGVLEANKRYPKRAIERNHQGVVVLWILIDRYGQIANYRIEQSSGSTILDGEVVRLVKKIKKLPMMPAEMARDSYEMTIPIRFVLIDDPAAARSK